MSEDQAPPSNLGRYRIIRVIGRGTAGVVYEGHDPSLDRRVAIKTLRKDRASDADAAARFVREALAVARLAHPNIVSVYDAGEQDDVAYMVMEFISGGELKKLFDTGKSFDTELAVRIASELLQALDYAHKQGVVHRDVKPANVLLDEIGNVKLTDFGIARLVDAGSDTVAGTLIGTPRYMAPEQVRGETAGPAADIYSAGAILYRMLAGREAFDGAVFEVMHAILNQQPERPSVLNSQSPAVLDAVVMRALDKRPEHRYPTARDFRLDLNFALALPEVQISAPGDLSALSRPASARPAPATVAVPLPAPTRAGWLLAGRRFVDRLLAPALWWKSGAPAEPPGSGQAPDAGVAADATWVASPELLEALQQLPGSTGIEQSPSAATDLASGPPDSSAASESADSTMLLRPADSPQAVGMPAVQLVVTASTDTDSIGRRFAIAGPAFSIGRDISADLQLADPLWSRRHVLIRHTSSGFAISDLGSSNGTFVNGRRVGAQQEIPLLFGAGIRVGGTVFTFRHARNTSLPDLTDQTVAGRYRLLHCLRTSPKSAVYEANDSGFGGTVAVKLLSAELASYPGYREQFQHEAAIAQRLQHPHICPVRDHGTAELNLRGEALHVPYVCYSMMGGGSLADRLSPSQPIDHDQVSRWVQQLSSALAHAHRNGVVHGDLKPAAICFDSDGNAYLTDFASAGRDGSGPLTGVPAFMAPEQWQSGMASTRSDQFALAGLAYLLLTGARPFEGQDDPQVRERNFRAGPLPARDEARRNGRAELSKDLSEVLKRALAANESDRFESIEQFAQAFDAGLRRRSRTGTAPSVFVSYQRDLSAGWAVLLSRELHDRHGIAAFVDTQRLDGAMQFPDKLSRAIEDCEVFVCLLAEATLQSRWVREEIRLAHRFGRPMIPVFQESFSQVDAELLEPSVKALLHFDGVHLLDRRNIHVDHTIDDLARLVKQTLAADGR